MIKKSEPKIEELAKMLSDLPEKERLSFALTRESQIDNCYNLNTFIDIMMALPKNDRVSFLQIFPNFHAVVLKMIIPEEIQFDWALSVMQKYPRKVISSRYFIDLLEVLPKGIRLNFVKAVLEKIYSSDQYIPLIIEELSEKERFVFIQYCLDFEKTHLAAKNKLPLCRTVLEAIPENDRFNFVQSNQERIRDCESLSGILKMLPIEKRLSIAKANQDKLNKGYHPKFSMILECLPDQERLSFTQTNQNRILDNRYDIPKVVQLLPEEVQVAYINENLDKLSADVLQKILDQWPEEKRLAFAIQIKVKNGFHLAILLTAYPEQNRLKIAHGYLDKITGEGSGFPLTYDICAVLNVLPREDRFLLVQAKVNIFKKMDVPQWMGPPLYSVLACLSENERFILAQDTSSYELRHGGYSGNPAWEGSGWHPYNDLQCLLTLLSKEHRPIIADLHQQKISDTDELITVLKALKPNEQFSIALKCIERWKVISNEDLKKLQDYFNKVSGRLARDEVLNTKSNIINWIKALQSSYEIRKSARILAQGFRDQNCLFSKFRMTIDIHHKIVSFTGNVQVHSQEETTKIAKQYFCLPSLKNNQSQFFQQEVRSGNRSTVAVNADAATSSSGSGVKQLIQKFSTK